MCYADSDKLLPAGEELVPYEDARDKFRISIPAGEHIATFQAHAWGGV